jgi:flagellar basal-body rod modification protein FlgD
MDISGISVSDPIFGSGGPTEADLGKDSFMRLLVTQLRNQNPLEPAKNEQMLAQLAQFSSLEEMQELNDNILGLAVLQQANALMSQLTDSAALIGQNVKYSHPDTGDETWGKVESVKIVDGLAVLNIGGKDVPLANIIEVGTTKKAE